MTGPQTSKSPLLLAALLLLSLSPSALTPAGEKPSSDDGTYRQFVQRATDGDLSVDFRQFRLACLKATTCDPKGNSEDLVSMRRFFQAREYGKAVDHAEALINQGFVNIEAHMICAEAYEALKRSEKAKSHHDIAVALIHSILASGDGKTKKTAFEVIDTSEEYLIMRLLGLMPPFPSQSLITEKARSYDVLSVDDPKTGQKVSVYFSIDLFFPMKGL